MCKNNNMISKLENQLNFDRCHVFKPMSLLKWNGYIWDKILK